MNSLIEKPLVNNYPIYWLHDELGEKVGLGELKLSFESCFKKIHAQAVPKISLFGYPSTLFLNYLSKLLV